MEHTPQTGDLSTDSQPIERWLDVDATVVYNGDKPTGVWFRYYNDSHQIVERVIPITIDMDINNIYGGLMSWQGRYEQVEGVLLLTAVRFGGQWHDLN